MDSYFSWLPLDVLRLFVKAYLRPLDYHRALRCGSLFHVLTEDERITKEHQRNLAMRNKPRSCKYQRTCNICGFAKGKNKSRRNHHEQFKCQELCVLRDQLQQVKDEHFIRYARHVRFLIVSCKSCKLVNSCFLFPAVTRHCATCGGGSFFMHFKSLCHVGRVHAWACRLKQLQFVRNRVAAIRK